MEGREGKETKRKGKRSKKKVKVEKEGSERATERMGGRAKW